MAKSEDGGETSPTHRPLPSIGMALLPHERRAQRSRQIALGFFGLLLAAGALAATVGRPWLTSLMPGRDAEAEGAWGQQGTAAPPPPLEEAQPTAAPQPDQPPQAEEDGPLLAAPPSDESAIVPSVADAPFQPSELVGAADVASDGLGVSAAAVAPNERGIPGIPGAREVRRIGKARGFRDALVKAGVNSADADALVTALDKLVDFRHAQPEHELVLERDSAGRLQAFEYRASVTERFSATRQANQGWKGAQINVPVEHRRIARGGYVSDSLGRALDALGLKNSLAGLFVEAFEGKIDFKKHAREGDSFKLIVEEQYVDGQLLGYGKVQALEYRGARVGEARAFWFDTDKGGDFYDENGRGLHGGWLRTPVRYDHISSPFNLRRKHPILKRIMPHEGIDYAASPGTTVWAAADGVATFVGPRGANGNLIALEHAGGYETFYAHLSRISRGIVRGAHVRQRQAIGAVGSTGRSTGPHLHFALKRRGRFVDPGTQLNGPGKPLPEALQTKFKRLASQLKHELGAIRLAAAPAPADKGTKVDDEFHDESLDL